MSNRILCECGSVIESDEEPQLARVIPEDALFGAVEDLSKRLYELLQRDCDRSEWVKKHLVTQYPGPRPVPVPIDAMLIDLFKNTLARTSAQVLECRVCGRLLVECGRNGPLAVYSPEKTTLTTGAFVRSVNERA